MDNKKYIMIALIIVIIALASAIGYALFIHADITYETVSISNGTTVEVPLADDASIDNDNGIMTYTCPSKKVVMISTNSEENFTLAGGIAYAAAREMMLYGSEDVEMYNNYQIRENTINDTHYYIVNISNSNSHDNIVIAAGDINILKHMIDSIKFAKKATLEDESATTSTSSPTVKNTTDDNKYSEEDLMRASEESYYNGYSDGIDDVYYYDDYDYDAYSSESSSSDGSSDYSGYNFETTVDD